MTVIKGKQAYSFPTNSGNNSDVESLNLGSASASDAESLHNEPTRPFRPPAIKSALIEDLIKLKKAPGKKKMRRYQNRCLLQTLAEEEEDETVFVIMEPYTSPFAKLLQDDDALEFWNVFIDKSEEEQARVLDAFSSKNRNDKSLPPKEKSFARISQKIKRTIKVKKNLSLEHVQRSEDELIAFFQTTPMEVYVQYPSTYFERLLLHAIAQYHGLESLCLVEGVNKRVEVFSTAPNWIPAECFLTDFVAQLRK